MIDHEVSQSNTNVQPSRRHGQLTSVQITIAFIVAIGLILTISLSRRFADDRALKDVQNKVIQEIDILRREQADLIAELNYVRSDASVESWAHNEGKMVREGEVLIIPVPSGDLITTTPAPSPNVPLQTNPQQVESWELWWALFFDSEPPAFTN